MKMLKFFLLFLTPSILMPEIQVPAAATPATKVVQELPLYKENEHFTLYCEPVDRAVADMMLEQCELHWKQLSIDFDHVYSTKITFKMYPNIAAFHKAVGQPNVPDWFCYKWSPEQSLCLLVSPNNPGAYHKFDFFMHMPYSNLVNLFMNDKYKNAIPGWLYAGISLYKTCPVYHTLEKSLIKDLNVLPSLQQLQTNYDDSMEFCKIQGWRCSFSIVKFIDKKWGWEKIKALLADYTSLRSILGVTEEELRELWIEYLIKEYGEGNKNSRN